MNEGCETSTPAIALRVLLAQHAARPGEVAANVEDVCATLAENPDVDLVVFPELFLTGYLPTIPDHAQTRTDDPLIARMRSACREAATTLVLGYAERGDAPPHNTLPHDTLPYNAMLVIGPDGALAGNYRKVHLFGREADAFRPGDSLATVTTGGVSLGLLICFDLEFPEAARALALGGADLLVSIAANPVRYADEHRLAVRARSLDNRLPHVYVNMPTGPGDGAHAGESFACDADGVVTAEAGRGPGDTVCVVEVGRPAPAMTDYVRQLRPDVYAGEVRRLPQVESPAP